VPQVTPTEHWAYYDGVGVQRALFVVGGVPVRLELEPPLTAGWVRRLRHRFVR